ncbi:MAG: InlB B-repeat-containing protein, partial [Actinomycetes bacterium]
MKKTLLGFLALAIIPVVPIVGTSVAHAVATPFPCDSSFYQVSGGKFYKLNIPGYTFSQIGSATTAGNGFGYNPADNLLYGSSSVSVLQSIDSTGALTTFAASSISPSASSNSGGAFLTNDILIMVGTAGTISKVTLTRSAGVVTGGTTVSITASGFPSTKDVVVQPDPAVAGGYILYTLESNTLYIAKLASAAATTLTGSVTSVAITGLDNQSGGTGTYGAQYADSQGNLYFYDNTASPSVTTHALYYLTRTQATSGLSTLAITKLANATLTTTPNDGANCETAPSPFAPQLQSPANTSAGTITATSAVIRGDDVKNEINDIDLDGARICINTLGDVETALNDHHGELKTGTTCITDHNTHTHAATAWHISETFTGLTCNTTYYYQSEETDHNGFEGHGDVHNFTTSACSTSHTVTFNKNDVAASGTMTNETASVATALTSNGFSNTGYTFAGWATTSGGAVAYADGASFPFAADTTLYAIWTANTNNGITWNDNLGAGSSGGASTYTTATAIGTIPTTPPTRTGYTFNSWNTQADGLGTTVTNSYVPGSPYGSVTFYAKWTANTYAIHYDANGGGSNPADSSFTVGGPGATLNDGSSLSKTGYTFAGWTSVLNTGPALTSPYSPSGTVTIHALWTANTNNGITWNDNLGAGSSGGASTYTTATAIGTIPTTPPTRTGYTFNSWNTQADGLGTTVTNSYVPGSPYGSVTFYAKWTAISYTVTYNSQGGSSVSSGSYTIGGNVTLPSAPSYPGYHFNGWFGFSSGGSALSSPYSPSGTGDITLCAQWTINSYTLTYSAGANGSITGTTPQTVSFGSNGAQVTAVPDSGYHFTTWSDGVLTAARTDLNVSGNITVSASFAANAQYAYSYDGQGNTAGTVPSSGTFTAGDPAITTPGVGSLAKTGYTFAGWSLSSGGAALGASYSPIAATTFYA